MVLVLSESIEILRENEDETLMFQIYSAVFRMCSDLEGSLLCSSLLCLKIPQLRPYESGPLCLPNMVISFNVLCTYHKESILSPALIE